jgi:hypothetical protein
VFDWSLPVEQSLLKTDPFVFWVFIIFNRCQTIATDATTFILEKVSINGGGNGSFRQSKATGI